MVFARSQGIPVHGLLVSRVPDLIKIAFTAAAAHVTEIRLEGLTVLTDVIEVHFSVFRRGLRLIHSFSPDLCESAES